MCKFLRVWAFVGTQFIVSLPSFAQWEPDRQITNYPTHLDYGSLNNAWTIAVQDSLVHIVWEHRDGVNPGELYYVQSTDDGTNFGPHQQLTTGDSHHPSICVFDSFVHIAWLEKKDGNEEIYYNRSSDYGASWDIDNFRLTVDIAGSGYSSICCSDSFVHIAWQDYRDGNPEIYYNRSADYGVTWDIDNFRLTNNVAEFRHPSICCIDSFVHIAWEDSRNGEIYYNRSSDYGMSWDIDNFRLTNDAIISEYPSICCSDSFVHIAWQDGRDINWEIYYNRSSDYGVTWDIDNFRLTDDVANHSQCPSICCSDSCVHIVWLDDRDGNYEIYYNRSADYGANWRIADERLTFDDSVSYLASVACTKCPYDVHIAWTDRRDNYEIYYKRHKCPGSGIEEDKELRVESLELRVFPNPCMGKAVIKLSSYQAIKGASIKIYDLSGKLVKHILTTNHNVEINLEELTNGIYFVRVETHTGLVTNNYKATRKLTILK